MKNISIQQLKTELEWKGVYHIIKQLRPHLNEETYIQLVKEAEEKEGYQMYALYEDGEPKTVIGFMPMITLYNGKSIWVCDLVTDTKEHSKGYGKALLEYVHKWAKENAYDNVSLSSGLQRVDAHRFYEEKMNYKKVSYAFLHKLN